MVNAKYTNNGGNTGAPIQEEIIEVASTAGLYDYLTADADYSSDLTTENTTIFSAINELNEKINAYISNLQIANAYLVDTDESILLTEDGSELYLENPLFKYDTTISDIYTVVENLSETGDDTENLRDIISNTDKIVYLKKGNYKIYDIRIFYNSNFTLRGYDPVSTVISWNSDKNETVSYQQIQYQSNIIFENIGFVGFNSFSFLECENVTFKNCHFCGFPSTALTFSNCTNVRMKDCVFENIGTEITNHTNSGFAVRVISCTGTLVENCMFAETKGNAAVFFTGEIENITIRNNIFYDTAFAAIEGYSAVQKGILPLTIEGNVLMNIGFGEPSPNNVTTSDGVVTGVGCTGIYCGGTDTTGFPNSVVRNNIIYKCREVSIEGDWQIIENNVCLYAGVDSGVRPTPSRACIHVRLRNKYGQIVKNNICITDVAECITTVMDSGIGELTLRGNLFHQTNGSTAISFISCPKRLIIENNHIEGKVYINTYVSGALSIFDYLVIDNDIADLSLVQPLIFRKGYINLKEGTRFTDIYLENPSLSSAVSRNDDSSISIKKWGYTQVDIPYEGYLGNDNSDISLFIKLSYNSEADYALDTSSRRAIQLRCDYGIDSPTIENAVLLPGTDSEDVTLNILLKPKARTESKVNIRFSNSSNWWGDAYCNLKINYVKMAVFVKDGD